MDLHHLAAREVAGHVEVVDGLVHEESARHPDILDGRRFGIPGGDPHHVDVPYRTVLDGPTDGPEVMVEPAVETDLEHHTRFPYHVKGFPDDLGILVQRFLAEDVLARQSGLLTDARVGIRG